DAWMLQRLAHGELTLIGPTSGVPGFFLGPLWYYIGLPGYFLGGGNPIVICLWYVAVASLALPLFWKIGHLLFKNSSAAQLCAYALALCPGSIGRSVFIWNPLLSLPLMATAYYGFLRARESRKFLVLGFFAAALTLQSEFAYAVFFLPVLFILIPWLRAKFDWKDFFWSAVAIGVTLLPQAAFEARHQFLMTKALLGSMSAMGTTVGYDYLLVHRPLSLLDATRFMLVDSLTPAFFYTLAFLLIGLIGTILLLLRTKQSEKKFQLQLTLLLAVIPYAGYMVWRGNYGMFFDYYLTPHFIFLIPLILLGFFTLRESALASKRVPRLLANISFLVPGILAAVFLYYVASNVFFVENMAGLKVEIEAIGILYTWREADHAPTASFRIYTGNQLTEQYDYLSHWYADQHHLTTAPTVRHGEDNWYVLVEHNRGAGFDRWYQDATSGGILKEQKFWGALTLEAWTKK
ncbi:MAG TPA: hypothetical protein VFG51_01890, partial [Candidatus Saccharimonadia bacterium]|nr:hypothetical protein [Candidatus Saccharimonadia bacterium]